MRGSMKFIWKVLILLILHYNVDISRAKPQFWNLNAPSLRDLFQLDVKAFMPAGICYKQVSEQTNDPQFSVRTISYCCPGYRRISDDERSIKCEPVCQVDCSNGICLSPDVCECYPGYERRDNQCRTY